MSRIIVSFLVTCPLIIFALNYPVSAENENDITGFQNVQLWIYPEYDDPRLLVMLEGQIGGARPPVEISFLVPSTAEMYSAGSIDILGQYSGGPPQRVSAPIPGWDEVSYEVKTDTFRVEYYDPIISGHPDKSIYYEFRWLYPISGLEVIVLEPSKATNFDVSPLGNTFVDDSGFNYHTYSYTDLDINQTLKYNINYTRSDTRPSLAIEDNGMSSSTVIIIVIFVLSTVAIGIFLWIKKSKPRTRAERRQLARKVAVRKSADNQPGFCTQCGKPLKESYKYCPHCGAEI